MVTHALIWHRYPAFGEDGSLSAGPGDQTVASLYQQGMGAALDLYLSSDRSPGAGQRAYSDPGPAALLSAAFHARVVSPRLAVLRTRVREGSERQQEQGDLQLLWREVAMMSFEMHSKAAWFKPPDSFVCMRQDHHIAHSSQKGLRGSR
jgi:hypothetical protein